MPNDPTRGQGRPWKHQATAAERKQEAQAPWRREPARPSADGRRWSKKAKLGLTALGFLVFCGLLVWAILLLLPPKPACLVIFIADYEDNPAVPINLSGRTAAQGLEALTLGRGDSFFWPSGILHLKQLPKDLRTDQPWDENLQKFKEKTIVLFFGVHGGADREESPGEGAYLLPQDSDGRQDPKYRLRLKQVLARLAELPPEKNKVLILDATQVTAHWPLGILHNDFARQLQELEPEIAKVPNLLVLSASDIDQRSWVAEQWRTTVFSHFLIEGLKGAADVQRRGRINALDLFQYLSQNVEAWVRASRDAIQQPVMFPSGDQGKNLAQKIDLVLVKEPYQASSPEASPEDEDLAALQKAWQTFQRLEELSPSPAVYSPHVWRQYQEYLLRFEQAIRFGDQAAARRFSKRLEEKEQELSQGPPLDSALTSLAMMLKAAKTSSSAVASPGPEQLSQEFDKLWQEPEKAADVWANTQNNLAGADKARQLRVRAEMGMHIMRRAAEDPAKSLEKAASLARVIWKGSANLAPAEIQFLLIFDRDRPKTPQPANDYFDLVGKALMLRLEAEKTALAISPQGHSYSEQVYPWIREKVNAADQKRLTGQDLLLASDSQYWGQARNDLKDAQTKYEEAQKIAEIVRAALEVRDQGFERLPSYSRWLAQRRLPEDKLADQKLLGLVQELWKNLHSLDQILEKPEPAPGKESRPADANDPQLRNLRDKTDLVRGDLGILNDQFDGLCRGLSNPVDLQNVWRDVEDALAVPYINSDLRIKLLTNIERTARHFSEEATQKTRETHAVSGAENTRQAKESAQRQGQLALATLGKNIFDRGQGAGKRDFELVGNGLKTLVDRPDWRNFIGETGDQIGERWQYLPSESQRLMDIGQKADANEARRSLQTADRYTRLMAAGIGLSLVDKPVDEYRRWLLKDWLGWQAGRTWEDHLFNWDPSVEEPYYRQAGKLFLGDARRLDEPLKLHRQAIDAWQKKLDARSDLVIDGPERSDLTSEQSLGIQYNFGRSENAQVPSGYPVIEAEVSNELNLDNMKKSDRQVRRVAGDSKIEDFAVTVSSPRIGEAEKKPPLDPKPVPSSVTVAGHYRGQIIQRQTSVRLFPLPEIAQVQPQVPARASVAVRADDSLHWQFGGGREAVVILLDCSGSMWWPKGNPPGSPPFPLPPGTKFPEGCRFDQAVTALEEVISDLPDETWVSLWIFGHHAPGGSKEEGPIKQLRPMKKSTKAELKKLITKIRDEIVPYYGTPLVKTMSMAKNDFEALPDDIERFKTIVVLTDGRDEEFVETGGLEGIKNIPQYMQKKFAQSDIMINMVFFQLDKVDKKVAKASFEGIESPKWQVPGKLYYIDKDPKELVKALKKSLKRSLHYSVEKDNQGTRVPGAESLEVSRAEAENSRTGNEYIWFRQGLRPRDYFVRPLTDGLKKERISLESGDRLLLDLLPNPNSPFRRVLFSEEPDYRLKPHWTQENWRLAVLQNRKITDHDSPGLEMFVTLERKNDPDPLTVKQVKPAVWFEIKPTQEERQPYVRWRTLSGYIGPSWSFDVPQWPMRSDSPSLALPSIRAWWSEQPVPAARTLNKRTENKEADFNTLQDLSNHPVPMEGGEVLIESIIFEKHWVEISAGRPKEERDCLVVRLANKVKENPVWVQLEGIETSGHEHRFYKEAGKYTGIFWPVTPQKAKTDLSGLSLISLKTLKKQAQKENHVLEKALGEPKANDSRPPSILLSDENGD